MFINCGGDKTDFEGNQYVGDLQNADPSTFFSPEERWAFSSTGVFTGEEGASFITQDTSQNKNISEIYQTARLSPISLKYYGLCLRKGSYKVRLHFAEIMFSNNQKFSSLGRRIFNVSIQVSISIFD